MILKRPSYLLQGSVVPRLSFGRLGGTSRSGSDGAGFQEAGG